MKQSIIITALFTIAYTTGLYAQSNQYFYLHNNWQGSDRVLTVNDDRVVIMEDRTGSDRQQWAEVSDEDNQRRYLKNKSLGDSYLLQFGDGYSDENVLVIAVRTEDDNQFWMLVSQLEEGSKKIEVASLGSDYVLDCDSDKKGPLVFMAPSSNASGQFWNIESVIMPQDDESVDLMDNSLDNPSIESKTTVITQDEMEQLATYARSIQFRSGRSSINEETRKELDKIAQVMIKHSKSKFAINAYKDSPGSDSSNMRLTQSQADSIRQYLIDQGVNGSNLTARGFGEENPIGDNTTRSGRALNRRVEIKLLKN